MTGASISMNTSARGASTSVLTHSVVLFFVAFLGLALGMDRYINLYDEGIVLVGAMRVAAGDVPHRDFYANYGPAQFYLLAGLFKLLGQSVLVERAFDLAVRAATVAVCYAITAAYARTAVALTCAIVCGLWLHSISFHGWPMFPVTLLLLIAAPLVAPAFGGSVSYPRLVGAGMVIGLVALFRYDVGFVAFCALGAGMALSAATRQKDLQERLRAAVSPVLPYALGTALVFLPVAIGYLAVAPLKPFVHDIIQYPSEYYHRMRNLPFPPFFSEPAVYLPLPICGLAIYGLLLDTGKIQGADAADSARESARFWLIVTLAIITVVLYSKGLVRTSFVHMFASIVASTVLLAVVAEHALLKGRMVKVVMCMALATVGTAIYASYDAGRVRALVNSAGWTALALLARPAAPDADTTRCGTPRELRTINCFLLPPARTDAARLLVNHAAPGERIFVGTTRHDRLFTNDMTIYFAADLLPATRWHHYDPGLQTSAWVQKEMIAELQDRKVRLVVLSTVFDSVTEPNDASKSSGITLLDEYLRAHYNTVAQSKAIRLLVRKPE